MGPEKGPYGAMWGQVGPPVFEDFVDHCAITLGRYLDSLHRFGGATLHTGCIQAHITLGGSFNVHFSSIACGASQGQRSTYRSG